MQVDRIPAGSMHGGLLQVVSGPEACAPCYHPNGTGRGAGDERSGGSHSQGVLVHKAQREADGRWLADTLHQI